MRGGFQYQTQLMQDGWLGMPRENEDIEKRKGRATGRDAGPTHSDIAQGSTVNSSHLELFRLSLSCNLPSAMPPAPADTREIRDAPGKWQIQSTSVCSVAKLHRFSLLRNTKISHCIVNFLTSFHKRAWLCHLFIFDMISIFLFIKV